VRVRRWRYAGFGALLALGAPAGLLLLRLAGVQGEAALYGYVTLSTLAAFALFGFALGRQADRLDEASRTDPLTGLGNRRLLHERLGLECARSGRYAEPLSLLLMDLDGLKQVNDLRGHRAGDALLRRIADIVAAELRQVDLAARWGGDEFAVLAPRCDAAEAMALAERIRSEVESCLASATVSIGVVSTGGAPCDAEVLLRAADMALYAAKRAGRNRVFAGGDVGEATASPPPPLGSRTP